VPRGRRDLGDHRHGPVRLVPDNPTGPNGLFFGNPGQLGIQALACVIVAAFAFAGSYVILRIITSSPVRSAREEDAGLDISGFGEEAYVGEVEEARSTGVESDP